MLTAPLLAPSEVSMFTVTAVLDFRVLMKMLYGSQVPDRILNFSAVIILENFARLDAQLKATHVLPGDREHEWLFDAIIEDIDPDTHTLPLVPHSFQEGQRVRGILNLSAGGHGQGVLYVIQAIQ